MIRVILEKADGTRSAVMLGNSATDTDLQMEADRREARIVQIIPGYSGSSSWGDFGKFLEK